MKTAEGLVKYSVEHIGTPYVFGAKMEVVTVSKIYSWAKESPRIYTDEYIAKAKKYIGQIATDCSGLITGYTGIERSSTNYYETAASRERIENMCGDSFMGYGLWKQGHIGVKVSSIFAVEARGINYGTIRSTIKDSPWQYGIKLKDIAYDNPVILKTGWEKSEDGNWNYYQNGKIVKGCWVKVDGRWYLIDNAGNMVRNSWKYESADGTGFNGAWYYVGEDGAMLSDQWLQHKGEWYYLSSTGTMITDTFYKYDGKWFYLQKDGKMMKSDEISIPADQDGTLHFPKIIS